MINLQISELQGQMSQEMIHSNNNCEGLLNANCTEKSECQRNGCTQYMCSTLYGHCVLEHDHSEMNLKKRAGKHALMTTT